MHEESLVRSLLKEIEKKKKIPKKISIVVGKASGIDTELLRHSFSEHIFPDKGWQNVRLDLELEEPSLFCLNCSKEIKDLDSLGCPFCKSEELKILSGNKVFVKEVQ